MLNKSQILIVESREQLIKYFLEGWKDIEVTELLCALIFCIDLLHLISYNLMLWSLDEEAKIIPSGLHLMQFILFKCSK